MTKLEKHRLIKAVEKLAHTESRKAFAPDDTDASARKEGMLLAYSLVLEVLNKIMPNEVVKNTNADGSYRICGVVGCSADSSYGYYKYYIEKGFTLYAKNHNKLILEKDGDVIILDILDGKEG